MYKYNKNRIIKIINIKSPKYERNIFHCEKLKYLNLSNFNTPSVTNLISIFQGRSELVYLNVYQFKISSSARRSGIFIYINVNLKLCKNDQETKNLLSSFGKQMDCSDNCFNKNIGVMFDLFDNKCVGSCNESES